jgi:hypothetical protein
MIVNHTKTLLSISCYALYYIFGVYIIKKDVMKNSRWTNCIIFSGTLPLKNNEQNHFEHEKIKITHSTEIILSNWMNCLVCMYVCMHAVVLSILILLDRLG